ncbi:MAG: carboxypeptidase regulatory-like domain-containing protein [Candidatus Electrothrix sp. AW5]|nr:carboxypeptidase regulatory-like domain-containing protein [Candidatus Electrothrix gigas]
MKRCKHNPLLERRVEMFKKTIENGKLMTEYFFKRTVMKKLQILVALLLISILLGIGIAEAEQDVQCSASPQVMMQNIIKMNRAGKISETEMMHQLGLYRNSLPKNEWERLVNQFAGGRIQYAPSSAHSQLTTEAETETGAISGRVTDGTNGLANIRITVYNLDYKWIMSSSTDAAGNYTVNYIPSGTDYKVKFSSETGYGEEWYNNKSGFCSADSVSVTAPNTTENINAVLEYPGSSTISGTVTDENGSPLAGVKVSLYTENTWMVFNSTTTAANGTYQFAGVGTGRYKLKLDGGDISYISEWYNDKTEYWNADMVEVTDPANVSGINATLVTGGSISGKVTDSNGNPITWYEIQLHRDHGTHRSYNIGHYTINSTNGEYTIAGLSSGQYILRFFSWGFFEKWYGNKSDFDNADAELISVNSPENTPNINVVLEKGGSVSGKVTNENNVGIPDVSVSVGNKNYGGWVVSTDTNGDYTLSDHFATGSWFIEFDAEYENTGYANQWYDNKISVEDADPVYITAPNTVTINAQLERSINSGSISGRVTDGKNPLFGINVSVYDSNYSWIKSASTNCAGEYSVSSLAEGTYKVSFSDYTYGLSNKWYNDKADFESADPITVTNSSPATGIDAVLSSGLPNGQQMPLSPIMMLLLNH